MGEQNGRRKAAKKEKPERKRKKTQEGEEACSPELLEQWAI